MPCEWCVSALAHSQYARLVLWISQATPRPLPTVANNSDPRGEERQTADEIERLRSVGNPIVRDRQPRGSEQQPWRCRADMFPESHGSLAPHVLVTCSSPATDRPIAIDVRTLYI